MMDKVQQYVEKHHMIDKNDGIVVGVSGGADSICLLFILLELQKKLPFSIYVVHVNHKIREEAMDDAEYVKKICEEKQLPFFLIEEDVEELARKEHLSSEEAGRKVRYEAFEKVRKEYTANKIAVAHHKNDRAETVLFNLFRGSSIKGLSGIAPVRDAIIRPLLCLERYEIEDYLKERKIAYCIDKTNAEDTYTRNRIRNRILPYVEENICENVIAHISDTAEMVDETEQFLQKITKKAYEENVTHQIMGKDVDNSDEKEASLWIHKAGFLKLESIIQKYVIMKCMHEIAGSRKDITSQHVQSVLELFHKEVNKKVNLPYHMVAISEYSNIKLAKHILQQNEKKNRYSNQNLEEQKISLEEIKKDGIKTIEIPETGKVELRILPYKKSEGIPEKAYTKWFDCDKIGKSLLVRHRRTGDYFSIDKENHTKTIKEYMIHEKIPQAERNKIYLLAVENHVVWLIGYRISQYYKVNQNTKEILEVHIVGGNSNDRTC